MHYYDLYASGLLLPFVVSSLFMTSFLYGAGPFILWRTRKRPISLKKLRLFCAAYAIIIFSLLRIFNIAVSSSTTPAFLWGYIFYRTARKRLSAKGLLVQTSSKINQKQKEVTPDMKPAPELDKETFAESQIPFHQQERQTEQRRTYGPLDPPEKLPKRYVPLWSAVCLALLCVVLAVTCIFLSSSRNAARSELTVLESSLNKTKEKYNTMVSKYDTLKEDYESLDADYEDALYCRFMMTIHVGITVERDNEACYHTCLCEEYKKNTGMFWIMPTTLFHEVGIAPCTKCHTADEINMIYENIA